MLNRILTFLLLVCSPLAIQAQDRQVTWDSRSLMVDGKRMVPVMGEVHYSRLPENEWETELKKMKEGGVTIIATYVFWNHIEETEGIFNWSGNATCGISSNYARNRVFPWYYV